MGGNAVPCMPEDVAGGLAFSLVEDPNGTFGFHLRGNEKIFAVAGGFASREHALDAIEQVKQATLG